MSNHAPKTHITLKHIEVSDVVLGPAKREIHRSIGADPRQPARQMRRVRSRYVESKIDIAAGIGGEGVEIMTVPANAP